MNSDKFYTVRGYQLLEQNKNKLTPALEDYLEMIYRNIINQGYIRVNELAIELNVKPSSVSKMIAKLANLDFINYEKYGSIKLTPKGVKIGAYLMWRHNTIKDFFTIISDNDFKNILEETELVEHNLSKHTVQKLEKILIMFKSDNNIFKKFKSINTQK